MELAIFIFVLILVSLFIIGAGIYIYRSARKQESTTSELSKEIGSLNTSIDNNAMKDDELTVSVNFIKNDVDSLETRMNNKHRVFEEDINLVQQEQTEFNASHNILSGRVDKHYNEYKDAKNTIDTNIESIFKAIDQHSSENKTEFAALDVAYTTMSSTLAGFSNAFETSKLTIGDWTQQPNGTEFLLSKGMNNVARFDPEAGMIGLGVGMIDEANSGKRWHMSSSNDGSMRFMRYNNATDSPSTMATITSDGQMNMQKLNVANYAEFQGGMSSNKIAVKDEFCMNTVCITQTDLEKMKILASQPPSTTPPPVTDTNTNTNTP